MSTEISKQKPPVVIDGTVHFTTLRAGRQSQEFELSGDVLVEHFAAASRSDEDLLAAFRRGKAEILAIAEQAANAPANGPTELGTGDFDSAKRSP